MFYHLAAAAVFLLLAPVRAVGPVVPHSPCSVSFNGFELHNIPLNPYEIHDVPHLLTFLADTLPEGLGLHRAFDDFDPDTEELPHDYPTIVPAAVTVTIPSSVTGANDFIAVGQLKSHDLWNAAASEAPGVLRHLAGMVEKTRLNILAAYGRPTYVYISMPGFAIGPVP
ncbi:hypothetical protein DENSPDRAFT_833102 [Dentipellis sp. KUC8613]|nr:hypothetical protein DENSPDRAFT_833102 [Dentipellis sp. KUC8613]